MLLLKACERCHGDVVLQEDRWGQFLNCLQCGMHRDVVVPKIETGKARRKTLQAVLL